MLEGLDTWIFGELPIFSKVKLHQFDGEIVAVEFQCSYHFKTTFSSFPSIFEKTMNVVGDFLKRQLDRPMSFVFILLMLQAKPPPGVVKSSQRPLFTVSSYKQVLAEASVLTHLTVQAGGIYSNQGKRSLCWFIQLWDCPASIFSGTPTFKTYSLQYFWYGSQQKTYCLQKIKTATVPNNSQRSDNHTAIFTGCQNSNRQMLLPASRSCTSDEIVCFELF